MHKGAARRRILGWWLAAVTVGGLAGAAEAAWPERPITLVVPWAAGGGTDATARIIAKVMEPDLGVPVNVVNRTGGAGVVGHSAVATAPADGYTLGLITFEIGAMHHQGLTELSWKDYTPIALMNEDPAGVIVRADSPYKTAKELLDAIKAAPKGKFKASGTAQGGSWHIALGGMLAAAGLSADHVAWVPSTGAATALQDMVAGGVDFVTCSVPEAKALIDAGKVKALALMAEQRNPTFPEVPTLKEATGIDFRLGAWRGLAGPKGLPEEVTAKLVPLAKKVYDSKEFQDFMAGRGFATVYLPPDQFQAFMKARDEATGQIMKGLGLAK
ncbi:MAG: tripartite tricarboxylate transporter substrate binding protein [Geminicoccaceae bacterium]|nr:tripartite tricarboxylate transporter substrate binding protein [Geminicoccaceae bacterium]MDW8369275.1 tripartite tricarboxylate transporter substrate binding protein [Geminicoccaceae bacterium]